MSANEHLNSAQFEAMPEPEHWDYDVLHSSHDELKEGKLYPRRSRVLLSKAEHPDALEAEQTAMLMGTARGEYPTKVGLRH